MTHDDRDLMKYDVEAEAAYGPKEPPPLVDPPGMAETLRLLDRISRMPDIRFEKVQEIRDLIARGALETPERIAGTIRRLMEELGL